MKLLFACFLVCAFSFSLINTTPINEAVLYEEVIKSIDILHKSIKMGMQSLHSPRNIPEPCCWSAFKCFVNETLLLKPADSQSEKLFNTTLSRIQSSQRNVQVFLCNSDSDCDKNCYPCADYSKQPETEFLEDFKTLLQRLYQSTFMRPKGNRRSTP